tara:strand:- start:1207 stop:1404 length:198 start_codon:yes stop_codon:yes gene_type:complete
MKEIKPVDYILANRLGFLAGNVVTLLTEWQITRDVKLLEAAQQEVNNLLKRERFMEEREVAYRDN